MRFDRKSRFVTGAVVIATFGTTSVVWAFSNGRLPQSELSPIYHPTYTLYLQNDAADSWNAMRDYCKSRGQDIYPNGRISAYRTYDQQVQAKITYGSNAATPGTSNHGLGLAVDIATPAMRKAVDNYGEQFGWAKKWSDASWEWWHIKYRAGVWNGSGGSSSGGGGTVTPPDPNQGSVVLSRGSQGPRVEALQRALNNQGASLTVDGDFGPGTEAAVRTYQRQNALTADGIAGPKTLRSLNLPTT